MTSRQNTEISIPNFAGGQCSAKGIGTLQSNEFAVMNNIILKAGGQGFRSVEGNTALNSSVIGGGAPVTGLGTIKTLSNTESVVAVSSNKIYSDVGILGTFADITGVVQVTPATNNQWTLFQANALLIGVGGGTTDLPWKYTGTGNAALLGGSPPAGQHGFQYGNRTFIMNTVANPSTIYWSVLLNSEDWSSTGSGSSDVSPNDGDVLTAAVPINLNTVILFKRNSTYLMTGRDSPFPIFPLFENLGCVGKHAAVVNEGLAYFIAGNGNMVITDGSKILESAHLPDMDDVWKTFKTFRLPYLQGQVINSVDFDWIVWSCSQTSSDKNDYAAIWDIRHGCWLNCSNGFEANAFTVTTDNIYYMGGYDGKVYRLFKVGTYTQASNSSAAVSWAVESDWATLDQLLSVKQVARFNTLFTNGNTGTMTFSYAYDFNPTFTTVTFSIVNTGVAIWDTSLWDTGTWDGIIGKIYNDFCVGRGNVFKWRLSGSSAVAYDVSKQSLFGKNKSQRMFAAQA